MTRDELFQQFWLKYPRRRSKLDAKKVWHMLPLHELEAVLDGLDKALHSDDWRNRLKDKPDGSTIPYPATWLRAGGWMDEYHITVPQQSQQSIDIDRCEIDGCENYAVHSDLNGRNKRCREHVYTKNGRAQAMERYIRKEII